VSKEDEDVTDIKKLSKLLNQQLVSVFTTEPNGPLLPTPEHIVKTLMDSITLSLTEVLRRLEMLDTNKLPGPDNLHPKLFVKETAAIIAEPLRKIFQKSLTSRELPAD